MNNRIKKTFSAILLLSGSMAFAQDFKSSAEIETSCRIKAKEIAANTYRACVVDQKNSQIEQIKKEYQLKLRALKAHYESELKKMAGSKQQIEKVVPEDLEKSAEKPEDKSTDKMESKPDTVTSESMEPVVETVNSTGSEVKTETIANPEPEKVEMTTVEPVEKPVKVLKTFPAKKINKSKTTASKSPIVKKTSVAKNLKSPKIEKQAVNATKSSEMTIRLKQSPKGLIRDASGELPEPIPVEVTQDSSI